MTDWMETFFDGVDLLGEQRRAARGALARRFIVPPFSVLDARGGYWKERKRAWLDMGIQSEVGRIAKRKWEQGCAPRPGYKDVRPVRESGRGKYGGGDCWRSGGTGDKGSGTSVFDPVLCELVYRWFCPAGGQVVDPFAGGSVRGIVAAECGLRYWGCDLSGRQMAANKEQAEKICPGGAD